jgi:hypothetical protein
VSLQAQVSTKAEERFGRIIGLAINEVLKNKAINKIRI